MEALRGFLEALMGQLMVKDAGVWKKVQKPMIKNQGIWKPAKKVLIKRNGVWTEVYSAAFWASTAPRTINLTMAPNAPIMSTTYYDGRSALAVPGICPWASSEQGNTMNTAGSFIINFPPTYFTNGYAGLTPDQLKQKMVDDWNSNKMGFVLTVGLRRWSFNRNTTGLVAELYSNGVRLFIGNMHTTPPSPSVALIQDIRVNTVPPNQQWAYQFRPTITWVDL